MTRLIGIGLWALIPGFIAKNKGRSFWGYYFLSFLLSPLFSMIITIFLSDLHNNSDVRDYNMHWNDVQNIIPQAVIDHCNELTGSTDRLETYLECCVNQGLIKEKYIPAILEKFVSPEDFRSWVKTNRPDLPSDFFTQQSEPPKKTVILANILKGSAPDAILQHCDTIACNRVLLETYLMQCTNQGKISIESANMLLENYAQFLESAKMIAKQQITNLPAYLAYECSQRLDKPEDLKEYLEQQIANGTIKIADAQAICDPFGIKLAPKKTQPDTKPAPKVRLADTLNGKAPDGVLQHCDSIADKQILLETYLMQCENQGIINKKTSKMLLQAYSEHMQY